MELVRLHRFACDGLAVGTSDVRGYAGMAPVAAVGEGSAVGFARLLVFCAKDWTRTSFGVIKKRLPLTWT